MSLPLRQLEAFHSVVISGSMTEAAVLLKISQPAVSRLIASLEDSIGFSLFQRLSGRLHPTPEARYLSEEVAKALDHLHHISRLTEDLQDMKKGHLRVACLPGFATSLLPRVLARFLTERPGLTLTLEPQASERIADCISTQQFDVGLSEKYVESPAIESESLLLRTVCIVPIGHFLAKKKVVRVTDLDGIPLVVTSRDHFIHLALQEAFNTAGVEFKAQVETRQFATACIMVAEGYGVAVVSEIDAREYESEGLVIRPFKPAIPFQINILYPTYMPRSIASIEFVETLKQSLQPYLI